jgi:hypothetical protein
MVVEQVAARRLSGRHADVDPRTADKGVGSVPAIEHVVAGAPSEEVGSGPAIDHRIAAPAPDDKVVARVLPATAREELRPTTPAQVVVVHHPEQAIPADAVEQFVLPKPADEPIAARTTADEVRASLRIDEVVTTAGYYHVRAACPDQQIAPRGADERRTFTLAGEGVLDGWSGDSAKGGGQQQQGQGVKPPGGVHGFFTVATTPRFSPLLVETPDPDGA